MSNQQGRVQAWAELAGIAQQGYNDTFMQFSTGWPGTFNDKMILYLQSITGSSSTNLPDLERAVAVALGLSSWNEVGYNIKDLSWSPSKLFQSGEAGGYYDFTNLANLFQDNAGTTPVTATGQSVLRITDLGPNGLHLRRDAAATGQAAPVLTQDTSKYGLKNPAANSGTNPRLGSSTSGALSVVPPLSVFYAARLNTGATGLGTLLGVGSSTVPQTYYAALRRNASSENLRGECVWTGVANQGLPSASNILAGTVATMGIEFTSGNMALSLNGTQINTGPSNWTNQANAAQILYFGGIEAIDVSFSMLVINRILTTQEKTDLRAWALARMP